MKRSAVNQALKELEAMCEKYHCYLPPFCHFTPQQWQSIGHEYDEVRDCMLGWDITDYGMDHFDKFGFSLITIRTGNRAMADKYPKASMPLTISIGIRQKISSTGAVAMCSSAYTTVCPMRMWTMFLMSLCIPMAAPIQSLPAHKFD